jgi:hypothetical protein
MGDVWKATKDFARSLLCIHSFQGLEIEVGYLYVISK